MMRQSYNSARHLLRFLVALVLLAPWGLRADPIGQLIAAETSTNFAWERLATLCDTFGSRYAGSTNLEAALDWILAQMKEDGLENVHGEPAMTSHWVRGAESAEMLAPRWHSMPMLGLGGSVATPPGGITAPVLVVTNFAELAARAEEARGKIVVVNQPFTEYGETVQIRYHSADEASHYGGVAALIRSVTPFSIQSPHTGLMEYSNTVPKIPTAAITIEDVDMMQRMQERGQRVVVRLKMSAATLPNAPSRNIIAEVVGREHPEQVVIVSGHIDSWDVGQGAMDDGCGAIMAWESVRMMHQLGLRPRRTVRAVLWVDEENGGAGAKSYEQKHKSEMDRHILAIESDHGPFKPKGFSFIGGEAGLAVIKQFAAPLAQMGAGAITTGEGEADVGELRQDGVPTLALLVDDTKYFWFHHTQADTMDKLDPRELSQCAAAMAAMAYAAADSETPLPR